MEKEREMSLYSINAPRNILICNPHIHKSASLHPDRVLQFHDFIYCSDGEMPVMMDGREYILNKNCFMILHSGVHHFGKTPCKAGTKIYFIHAISLDGDAFLSSGLKPGPGIVEISGIVDCTMFPEIKKLMKEAIDVFWKEESDDHSKSSLLCTMLIYRVSEVSSLTKKEINDENLAEQCRSLILNSYDVFLSAKEMASKLYVSERTLRNAFILNYGITPIQYQRDLKLKKSIAMMSEYPQMSISEIAENLGYAYETHYNMQFRNKFGISPGEYRNQLKSGKAEPFFDENEKNVHWIDIDEINRKNAQR